MLPAVALVLGWRPGGGPAAVAAVAIAVAGHGRPSPASACCMAGTLRAEVTLAAANGLYLVLLLLGGMVIPLDELPGWLHAVADLLPAAALSDVLHGATSGRAVAGPGLARAGRLGGRRPRGRRPLVPLGMTLRILRVSQRHFPGVRKPCRPRC